MDGPSSVQQTLPSVVRLEGLGIPALPPDAQAWAGPFLRYQQVRRSRWSGSLLFLLKGSAAVPAQAAVPAEAAAAGASAPASPAAAPAPPRLLLADSLEQARPSTPAEASAATAAAAGEGGSRPSSTGAPAATTPGPPALLLDTVLGYSFWRFDLEFPLGPHERAVSYAVEWGGGGGAAGGSGATGNEDSGGDASGAAAAGGSRTETFTFWLPGARQNYHAAYYSCNGFSGSVPASAPERADPEYLWRDLLSLHSCFPYHVLIGGGGRAVWPAGRLAGPLPRRAFCVPGVRRSAVGVP